MNIITQQYQRGMDEFTNSFVNPDNPENEWHRTYPYHLKSFIKQQTLTLLQSEYDMLKEEIRIINGEPKPHRPAGDGYNFGRLYTLSYLKDHILQTINEIKGL